MKKYLSNSINTSCKNVISKLLSLKIIFILIYIFFLILLSNGSYALANAHAPDIANSNKTVYVSTYKQLIDAMSDNRVDKVILQNDIIASPSDGVNIVRAPGSSPNRMKILDGNGNRLLISARVGFDGATNIDAMVIRNFSNIYTKHRHEDQGFFRLRTHEYDLHVENIILNKERLEDGAHLASSWESTLHLYGDIDLYSPSLPIAYYRLIKIHDGANVNIYSGGDAFYQGKNTNLEKGIIIDRDATVNIISKNNVINNLTNGSGKFKFHVGSGSDVTFESLEKAVIYTRNSPNSEIYFGPDSKFSGISKNNTFNLAKSSNFLFAHPESVRFHSSVGQIINDSTNIHQFKIYNLKMKTANIETEEFISGVFYVVGSSIQNFSANKYSDIFPSKFIFRNMRDWEFYREFENPKIDNIIYDTDYTISGKGPSSATIYLIDKDGDIISETNSNVEGNFVFNLKSPLDVGIDVGVKAERTSKIFEIDETVSISSDTTWYTVVGNRLELVLVSDLLFENTVINNEPNKEIPTMDPVNVQIRNTKLANWTLTAKAAGPLTNNEGHTLDNALYFRDKINNYYLMESIEVRVYEHNSNNADSEYYQNLVWKKGEGFVLRYNPINAYSDSDYTTTIKWTLTDAIQ